MSATAASNSPAGTDTIGTNLDDFFRAGFAILRGDFATKGTDIASAATADLGAVQGLFHDITGTTPITSFGTVAAGVWKVVKFEGALTLTHNATSLILPRGANITTADGDVGIFTSEGSGNWRCVAYMPATGILSFVDTNAIVQGSADGTKKLRFEVDGFTTGTTRVLTPPNFDLSLGIVAQNSQSAAYTTVLADADKHILHPTADNNARTFTIDSNANVAYPIGTTIAFVNQINTLSVAITSDTMTLLGAGSTGTRTVAANGMLVAMKIAATAWVCWGQGVT